MALLIAAEGAPPPQELLSTSAQGVPRPCPVFLRCHCAGNSGSSGTEALTYSRTKFGCAHCTHAWPASELARASGSSALGSVSSRISSSAAPASARETRSEGG